MARILLLDKANVIERVQAQLTALGHEVNAADTDAYAGLGMVMNSNADLMMISLGLPGGGAQLIDKLRADTATSRTPIIVLFDDNWSGVKQDALTRFLQKPTDPETLKFLLDELLPKNQPPKQAAPAPMFDGEGGEGGEPMPPLFPKAQAPIDMGAPSDDDLPPGEILEL